MPVDKRKLMTADESGRLRALEQYRIAGTAPEKLFDDMAQLVAKLFDAPIALVSLVAQNDVWFKANAGLPGAVQVPREDSLCSVAVLHDAPVVFEDLEKHPCELTNPDVATALQLRFYAGAPLQDRNGHNIGTLCVIDRQPRTFTAPEQELLTRMASMVMRTIELRLATMRSSTSHNAQLRLAYDALQYSLDRLTDLVESSLKQPARASSRDAAERDTAATYRVANEILDYATRFVSGSLELV